MTREKDKIIANQCPIFGIQANSSRANNAKQAFISTLGLAGVQTTGQPHTSLERQCSLKSNSLRAAVKTLGMPGNEGLFTRADYWGTREFCTKVADLITRTERPGISRCLDRPLNRPPQDAIIYELHVGGFTRHRSSGVRHPGTFVGVAEKVPYLKELGVTAVELMPVMSFDDKAVMRLGPGGEPLRNYWGYSTLGFFAPENGYCVAPQAGQQITEFRDMVKALHRAGIEVILDVVFNHTDEGNENGPTFSFKSFATLRGIPRPPRA
jgi:hypothetical protein